MTTTRSWPLQGVVGVINATPDSFSDAGRWTSDASALVQSVKAWHEAGVAMLDIGGESTRPGATPVDPDEEWARVEWAMKLVQGIGTHPPLSVDTRRARVAAKALAKGACVVNDVSGLADPEMIEVVAEHGCGLIVGHLRGNPSTMQDKIEFEDVVQEVADELSASVARAVSKGVARSNIVVDPGLGFGKTTAHCLALLVASRALREHTGCPVMIGASRKRFLGEITGTAVTQRKIPSVVAALLAAQHGAALLRVHDVLDTLDALALWRASQGHGPGEGETCNG